MGSPIIPPAGDPAPAPQPDDKREGKIITCEGCGSRVDRRGNLLKRGDRLREALDSEDTVIKLRKQIETLTTKISDHEATIAELRSKQTPEKTRSRFSLKADA